MVDCQDFCGKTGLSFSTDTQWEYACRAGSVGSYGGTRLLDDMGWYGRNSGARMHPVGKKKPNAFGIYDMHGNVAEWWQDYYDADFYRKPQAVALDPVCSEQPQVPGVEFFEAEAGTAMPSAVAWLIAMTATPHVEAIPSASALLIAGGQSSPCVDPPVILDPAKSEFAEARPSLRLDRRVPNDRMSFYQNSMPMMARIRQGFGLIQGCRITSYAL